MARPATGPRLALALALAATAGIALTGSAPSRSTARLVARLRAAGRAEAPLTQITADPLGGPPATVRGRLTLELPDRVRLDFPASGERLTVRSDGGEWLQPAVRQMLVLNQAQARASGELWRVMLEGGGEGFEEHRRGAGRFAVQPPAGSAAPFDSLLLQIDRAGLPVSLVVFASQGESLRYRFGPWRFRAPRGAAAFTLRAPVGWTVLALP